MKLSEKFTIFLGIALVSIFVIGLAWSISTGLAGFWKGLPFLDYRNILSLSSYSGFIKSN